VALASSLPGVGTLAARDVVSRDAVHARSLHSEGVTITEVSPGYFRVLGLALIQGRDIGAEDALTSPHVTVVSRALATRLWPHRPAVGAQLAIASSMFGEAIEPRADWLDVVGVVEDVPPALGESPTPAVYVSLGQQPIVRPAFVLVGGAGSADRDRNARVAAAITAADPSVLVQQVRTMEQVVAEVRYPHRLAGMILGTSGAVGLILAMVGLYGLISLVVAQRRREIGIRTALGARQHDLVALVAREAVTVTVMAVALGCALSLVLKRVSAALLGPLPAGDAVTFAGALVPVVLTVLLACYLPARRAGDVNPIEVLRG
jgi:hypothetical protein